ncbi:hypothetical protein BHE97_04465 [Aeromicrobium sp. PE09-221]|uniref:DUF2877 domain-containing protein n=1 Tax=Aeromicrobium sp. PE09-221 TaxID=1898043 RepID=UPI000B3ED414|nr:DUF2877 domain-containing protein [Aeromicrobium sp. PE09-221]OUZ11595.1 hypothetical protein BHE97_04465 [Aeromicrobium sp. PE09-221]
MSERSSVAAAATTWVRERIARPSRPAEIVHRGGHAVYLDDGTDVLAVVGVAGVRVPCAAQTTLPSLQALTGEGSAVTVGDGRLVFAGGEVRISRTVDQHVPALDPASAGSARERLGDVVPIPIAAELPSDALAGLRAADPAAPLALVGLGSGLTPLGDDVLCGWVATMAAARRLEESPMRRAIDAPLLTRTTSLSATLIRCALEGFVIPEFARLLASLRSAPSRVEPADAAATMLRIGHTSGAGLVLGLTLALEHLSTATPAASDRWSKSATESHDSAPHVTRSCP